MSIQLERHLFSLEEFERVVEAGGFDEDARIELIRGEIVDRAPIGFEHGMAVAKLNRLFIGLLGDSAIVWVQSPVQIAPNSRPEPDLALLKGHDYGANRPVTASDLLLVVEVSDTTLTYDRTVKGPLYAQAGIPEYWIVNLQDKVIEVYTGPSGGRYDDAKQVKRGNALALPGGLGSIPVSSILGSTS
jgi:Uma2 family endonuclease